MLVFVVAALALAVVLLTSLIKNVGWGNRAKNAVATVLSVISAGAIVLFGADVDLSPGNLLNLTLAIYGSAQLIYNFILTGTTVEQRLAETHVI